MGCRYSLQEGLTCRVGTGNQARLRDFHDLCGAQMSETASVDGFYDELALEGERIEAGQ